MSLATTGGGMGGGAGAGGGAMTMAHHAGPNAVQVARQAGTQGGGHTRIDGGASGQAPPSNLASLAADQMGDKRLQKLAKNTLHLPIVGVDLGGQTHVCYQPPIAYEDPDGNLIPYEDNDDGSDDDDDDDEQPQGLRLPPTTILGLGKGLGSNILLQKTIESDLDGTASAYKTARKLLTKGTNQMSFLREHPIQGGPPSSSSGEDDDDNNNESILTLPRPHSVLGVRRIQELDTSLKDFYGLPEDEAEGNTTKSSETSQAINPISSDLLQDQALDGSNPKGDDYDRVSFVSRLHPQKKPLTILPEEAVGMLLLKSKQLVHEKMMEKAKQELANNNNSKSSSKSNGKKKKGKGQASSLPTEDEEDKLKIIEYGDDYLTSVPIALAIPGYATCDSSIEAYKEVIQSASNVTEELVQDTSALLFPRSACAITAAMYNLVNPSSGKVLASKLFGMFLQEHKLLSRKASQLGEPSEGQHVMPLLVTVGVTCEGYEICSILLQTDMQQRTMPECAAIPLEEYRYLHCQCSRFDHVNPSSDEIQESIVESLKELKHDTQITVGKSRTPFAILIYGDTLKEMHQLETMIKDSNVFETSNMVAPGPKQNNETLNTVLSREDGVAFGTALMAASACGRTVSPSVNVMTVCTSSVGLKISYSDKISTIKTIFDFDRRLPAGPYEIEFSALECAAVRLSNEGLELLEDTASDEYEKALKPYEGKKGIPQREEAALALTVQLVQQSERGGEWIPLGDAFQPLVCEKEAVDPLDDKKDKKEEDNRIACETSTLELKLRPEGIVVTGMDQHGGISVRQALKNSFWNTIYFYLTVLGCIAFFGGFLVKSYWEDYTFQRDTKRVLAYYKRAIPGSMHDGDEHGARYLVYKYRHKKAKLWTRLEKKYDYPIPEDWDTFVEEVFEEIRIEKLQRQEEAEARERGEWDGGSSESKKNENVEEENLDSDAPPRKDDPRKSTTTPVDDDDDEDHEL